MKQLSSLKNRLERLSKSPEVQQARTKIARKREAAAWQQVRREHPDLPWQDQRRMVKRIILKEIAQRHGITLNKLIEDLCERRPDMRASLSELIEG